MIVAGDSQIGGVYGADVAAAPHALHASCAVSKGCAFVIVLCLGLIFAPSGGAQVLYGSLTGTVTDATLAPFPTRP